MEIRNFVRPLFKWWWLIVAATSLAVISTYIAAQRRTLVYEASTTLAVGRTIFDPNPNSGDLYLGQQLAGIYANFALQGQIQKATMDVVGLDELPEHVIRVLPNTQFIEITVKDTNPGRAQVIANELAHQLILLSPSDPQDGDQERQIFVQEQLDYLEVKIDENKDEIEKAQTELAEMTSARQITDTQETIAALQHKLTDLQSNYAALLAGTRQEATNIISIIGPASVPFEPVGASTPILVALSALVAFALSAGAAYLLEYLDDTLQSREDIMRVFSLPILGYIPRTKRLVSKGENGILFLDDPNSSEADTFRILQTNLRFAWGENCPKSILVTSLEQGEGKTTIAVNLAAAFAKNKKQVLLVDADLRRSKVHRFARIPNELGLGDALYENLDPAELTHSMDDLGFKIITSGNPDVNPMELLDSNKLSKMVANLEGQADLVIFDAPPLPLPETMVLASQMDGVIIVVRSGRVRETNVTAVMEQLKRAQANLLGIVLNGVPRGSDYNHLLYLYGYKGIPHQRETSKDAVQKKPRDPVKSESGTKPRFRKKTKVMEKLKGARPNLLGGVLNRVPPGSVNKNTFSLYGRKKITHKQEIAKDAVQKEPGDPAESESGKKSWDHKKTKGLVPAIFLDRDGVIIENRPDYVRSWNNVFIYPQVLDALARVSLSDFKIVIVTNQSVVGRGLITHKQAEKINQQLVKVIEDAGGRVDGVFMCPHHPDQDCPCRKPKPELILRAAESLSLDLSASIMVGDAFSDLEAGKAAGVSKLVLVKTGRGTEQSSQGDINDFGEEAMVCETLADALDSFVDCHNQEANE